MSSPLSNPTPYCINLKPTHACQRTSPLPFISCKAVCTILSEIVALFTHECLTCTLSDTFYATDKIKTWWGTINIHTFAIEKWVEKTSFTKHIDDVKSTINVASGPPVVGRWIASFFTQSGWLVLGVRYSLEALPFCQISAVRWCGKSAGVQSSLGINSCGKAHEKAKFKTILYSVPTVK